MYRRRIAKQGALQPAKGQPLQSRASPGHAIMVEHSERADHIRHACPPCRPSRRQTGMGKQSMDMHQIVTLHFAPHPFSQSRGDLVEFRPLPEISANHTIFCQCCYRGLAIPPSRPVVVRCNRFHDHARSRQGTLHQRQSRTRSPVNRRKRGYDVEDTHGKIEQKDRSKNTGNTGLLGDSVTRCPERP